MVFTIAVPAPYLEGDARFLSGSETTVSPISHVSLDKKLKGFKYIPFL